MAQMPSGERDATGSVFTIPPCSAEPVCILPPAPAPGPAVPEWVDLSSSPAHTAKSWVVVAHSKVTSAKFLGSQGSKTTSLASQKMCSPAFLPEKFLSVTLPELQLSAHVLQPEDAHKGIRGKRTYDLIETIINILAYFLRTRYAAKVLELRKNLE